MPIDTYSHPSTLLAETVIDDRQLPAEIQKHLLELETMGKGELFDERGLLQNFFQHTQDQLQDMFQQEVTIARNDAQSKSSS